VKTSSWSGAGSNRRPSAFQVWQTAKSYGMTSAGTGAEVRLWSWLVASVAVTVAVNSLTGDPLLRRSFRATPPSAAVQARPRAVGRSVHVNGRSSGPVLARIWHASAGHPDRSSMRTTGRLVNAGHRRRCEARRGRTQSSDVGSAPAESRRTFATLTLKCHQAGTPQTISLGT